jgi:hypothetical protein
MTIYDLLEPTPGGTLRSMSWTIRDKTVAKSDFKLRARKAAVALEPDRSYRPAEVASILNVSYDTALRRMRTMSGAVNLGTKETLHKRGKSLLSISGRHLAAYLKRHAA